MNGNDAIDPANTTASGKPTARVAPALCDHLDAHPSEAVEVLISLDTPQPDLSGIVGGGALDDTVGAKPGDPSLVDAIVERVRGELSRLGIPVENWQPNAHCFVASVTADQVEQISGIEGVLEILPNQTLK